MMAIFLASVPKHAAFSLEENNVHSAISNVELESTRKTRTGNRL